MGKTRVVKARENYGSRSLSLTLPADVREEFGVRPGDVFEVSVSRDGPFTIRYRKIYSPAPE